MPETCYYFVGTVFHYTHAMPLPVAELAVIDVFFGKPLQSNPIFMALVEYVILPASKVYLACVVPDDGGIVGKYEDAVVIFLDAEVLFVRYL